MYYFLAVPNEIATHVGVRSGEVSESTNLLICNVQPGDISANEMPRDTYYYWTYIDSK
jgi:hypothetical protein